MAVQTMSPQVETAASPLFAIAPAGAPHVVCSRCRHPIADHYFNVNSRPFCAACRDRIVRATAPPRGAAVFARAAAFGAAGALPGAFLYYAFVALTHLEVGIVAIAIGYMVGYAVRAGARRRGGRRFQVLALVLTYWAVGVAYTLLAGPSAGSPAFAFALSPVLPVTHVVGSFPLGALNAAIIGFGMHQAWTMTGTASVVISGPHRLGGRPVAV